MAFHYMPSELARLVYGYFRDVGCDKTASKFLEESSNLKEFAEGINKGLRYSSKISNESLLQILNSEMLSVREQSDSLDLTLKNSFDQSKLNSTLNNSQVDTLINYFSGEFTKTVVDSVTQKLEKSLTEKLDSCGNKNILSTPKNKFLSRNVHFSDTAHPSPRRKSATPKRLASSIHLPLAQIPTNRDSSQSTAQIASCAESSPLFSSPITSSSACESSEFDIVVQPQLIYDELLKFMPLQEKLANKINQTVITKDGTNEPIVNTPIVKPEETNIKPEVVVAPETQKLPQEATDKNVGDIEKDLIPMETLGEIINSIEGEPEFNEFVEMVIEKEIASTPFKLFPQMTPSSTGTSLASLNTPEIVPITPDFRESKNKDASALPVAKNLWNDWKTPVKNDCLAKNSEAKQPAPVKPENSQPEVKIVEPKTSVERQMKPVFQNQHLHSQKKFLRLKSHQKEVHEAINYTPMDVDFARSEQPAKPKLPNRLTTQIEQLPLTPKVSEPAKPVEVYLSSWQSSSQPILVTDNDGNVIGTMPAPEQQPIYYLNDSCFQIINPIQPTVSQPITTIDASSLSLPIIGNFANPTVTTVPPPTIINTPKVDQVPKTPTIKQSPRIVPAILSKGKMKKQNLESNENKEFMSQQVRTENIFKPTDSEEKGKKVVRVKEDRKDKRKEMKKLSPKEVEVSTRSRIKRKSLVKSNSFEKNEKTKSTKRLLMDQNEKQTNKQYSIDTNDNKIKKLFATDFDQFLGNLHGNSQLEISDESDSKNKKQKK